MTAPTPHDDRSTTVFVHVPKTAGTSVIALLRQEYGRPAVRRMYGKESQVHVEELLALPAHERAGIRAITGHVEFGLHHFVAGPMRYITLLRDPIDRVVSNYHYTRHGTTLQWKWALHELEGVHSLADYVNRSIDSPHSNNAHVRLLGGDLREPNAAPTRRTLERAKHNLEHFAVVGLQERFEESVLLMRRALGWGWPSLRQQNVTTQRVEVTTLDAHLRDLIAEYNALDMELYEYGRACFARQLAAYGPGLDDDLAVVRRQRAAPVAADTPSLSVVVMGYRDEATIVAAAQSLLPHAHDDRVEVIAVLSGGDRSAELLREHAPELRVVNSPTRLLPGGARNLGVANTRGDVVAFLAGDCVAAPGWLDARLAAHRAGHEVVAGAMAVAEGAGPLAIAELLLGHSDRLAQGPARRASHRQAHGLSFTRRVLNEIGPFRDDIQAGEATFAAHHLYAGKIPIWFDPSIVVEHVGPAGVRAFVREQHERGRREGELDFLQGGFPRRWFDAIPWLGVVLRGCSRSFARMRSIAAGARHASRGHRWRVVAAMPAVLVGLLANQWGWMGAQHRARRRPSRD